MATRADITPELCRQLLDYDPETGKLFWKARSSSDFKASKYASAEQLAALWNRKNAYGLAFTATKSTGYRHGNIQGVTITAHRVAFAIYYGRWPSHVDHINGDRTDNRIENLREVTASENHKNRRKNRGENARVGVSYSPQRGRWQAQICSQQKRMHLGWFDTEAEALAAREKAERQLEFHPNHGRLE